MSRKPEAKAAQPWEALALFVDRDKATEFYHLVGKGFDKLPVVIQPDQFKMNNPDDYNAGVLQCRKLERELSERLHHMLRSGELLAEGFSSGAPVDAPRRKIHPERWDELKLDIRDAIAKGRDLTITQIRISPTNPDSGDIDVLKGKRPQAELRQWYRDEWIPSFEDKTGHPSAVDDWTEAKRIFADNISRERVRDLRRELAPESWKRRGRRIASDVKPSKDG